MHYIKAIAVHGAYIYKFGPKYIASWAMLASPTLHAIYSTCLLMSDRIGYYRIL